MTGHSPSRDRSNTHTAVDRALVTLFVGAMMANDHVSPREGARAHHLIWSTHRFRRKSGDTVGRLIDRARTDIDLGPLDAVMTRAAKAIPGALRPSALALVADLLLADGRMDAKEQRFLQRLGADLRLAPATTRRIVDAMQIKNLL